MANSNLPPNVQSKLDRLVEVEAILSAARHDIRGILNPMLLVADRLAMHTDEKIVRCANTLTSSVKRIDAQLAATKGLRDLRQ